MENHGIIHPEQLTMLTEALDDYCRQARINPGSPEFDIAASRIIALFANGVQTAEALLAALNDQARAA